MKTVFSKVTAFFLSACMLVGLLVPVLCLPTVANAEVVALQNHITDMNLDGYVGENLINNVKNWQLSAYENNRGIVMEILVANANGLTGCLGGDVYGQEAFFTIDMVEEGEDSAIGWTLNAMPSTVGKVFNDRDFRYTNDSNAITDWTGADELWIHVDASTVSSSVSVRVGLEDNAVSRESYRIGNDYTISLLADNATSTTATVVDAGYVPLPVGFSGYMRLPLTAAAYSDRYWGLADSNSVFEISNVAQFQISVKGDEQMVDKTVLLGEFAVVGDVNGQTNTLVPEGKTYKEIWDLEKVDGRIDYTSTGGLMAWHGEFVGKLLTGMAYSYKATADAALKTVAEEIITDLADAQGDDGNLGVFTGTARYSLGANNWDLWNQYHCISGLLEWYELTGNETALKIAKGAADCIYDTFTDNDYSYLTDVVGGVDTNRGIAHGFAQLYQATEDEKYLNEAKSIIDEDCKANDPNGWYNKALSGDDFYTSVNRRWEILHMVMTLGILYEETGNQEYYNVMSAVWESVLKTDIHNAGTFTTNEGAQGDPYLEGAVETCCTIAWAAFTNEYYKYNQSVKLVDEMERTYLNGVLGGLLDDDKYCTYNTPMDGVKGESGGYDGRRVPSQQDIKFQYNVNTPDMNCCQANIARGLGQVAEWAVMSGNNSLYVNYYGPSAITTLVDSKTITLTQETAYPINGNIRLTVSDLAEDTAFALKLRIPTWAEGSKVTVDGSTYTATSGEYYTISKTWKNGDVVDIELVIPITYLKGEGTQLGYTSVFYGSVLLTLDQYYASGATQSGVNFTTDIIEAATVVEDTSTDTMLQATVLVNGKKVKLVDYASAGKYNGAEEPSTYWSWLWVSDGVEDRRIFPNVSKVGAEDTYADLRDYSNTYGVRCEFSNDVYGGLQMWQEADVTYNVNADGTLGDQALYARIFITDYDPTKHKYLFFELPETTPFDCDLRVTLPKTGGGTIHSFALAGTTEDAHHTAGIHCVDLSKSKDLGNWETELYPTATVGTMELHIWAPASAKGQGKLKFSGFWLSEDATLTKADTATVKTGYAYEFTHVAKGNDSNYTATISEDKLTMTQTRADKTQCWSYTEMYDVDFDATPYMYVRVTAPNNGLKTRVNDGTAVNTENMYVRIQGYNPTTSAWDKSVVWTLTGNKYLSTYGETIRIELSGVKAMMAELGEGAKWRLETCIRESAVDPIGDSSQTRVWFGDEEYVPATPVENWSAPQLRSDYSAINFGFDVDATGIAYAVGNGTYDEARAAGNYTCKILDANSIMAMGNEKRQVLEFGALISTRATTTAATLTKDYVNDGSIKMVKAEKLYELVDNTVSYTVRVVGIGENYRDTRIFARSYVKYIDANGNEAYAYGDVVSATVNELLATMPQ